MWKCLKCKREFEKRNQVHSCTFYPEKKHFENKPAAMPLYQELKRKVKQHVGQFKVESLPCCIHFVKNAFTFAGAFVLKDKIRIFFMLEHELKSSRIYRSKMISMNRHEYLINIQDKKEINKELLDWINEAYTFRKK
jgi:hypothetical protein